MKTNYFNTRTLSQLIEEVDDAWKHYFYMKGKSQFDILRHIRNLNKEITARKKRSFCNQTSQEMAVNL